MSLSTPWRHEVCSGVAAVKVCTGRRWVVRNRLQLLYPWNRRFIGPQRRSERFRKEKNISSLLFLCTGLGHTFWCTRIQPVLWFGVQYGRLPQLFQCSDSYYLTLYISSQNDCEMWLGCMLKVISVFHRDPYDTEGFWVFQWRMVLLLLTTFPVLWLASSSGQLNRFRKCKML